MNKHDNTMITLEIFSAFQECHLKAYNIFRKFEEKPAEYTRLIEGRQHILKEKYINKKRKRTASFFSDSMLIHNNLKTKADFLIEKEAKLTNQQNERYIPLLFLGTYKAEKTSKLRQQNRENRPKYPRIFVK